VKSIENELKIKTNMKTIEIQLDLSLSSDCRPSPNSVETPETEGLITASNNPLVRWTILNKWSQEM
jgi:hypothetical protein